MEYGTDNLLVELVRIQRLTERIFQVNRRDQLLDGLPGRTQPETPTATLLSALEEELDGQQSSLPHKLKNDCLAPPSSCMVQYVNTLLTQIGRFIIKPLRHRTAATL